VKLRYRFVTTTVILNLVALSLLIYRQVNIPHADLWFIVPYLLFLGFLANRARALKSRVAELVDLAAHRAGLQRVFRHARNGKRESGPEIEVPMNVDPAARI